MARPADPQDMSTVVLEPRRSVRFWATRALVLAGAIALGLALQHVLSVRLESIQSLARDDVIAARRELATLLRVGGLGLFGFTTAVGVAIVASCRRALREERFPPTGLFSWGATRIVTGPRARGPARAGLVIASLLIVASVCGAAIAWYASAVLLACRAT